MQNKKILIVDDEPDILYFLSEILSSKNFIVSTCQTVKEALTLLEERTYDIVVTDYNIGQRTGKEIVDFVKHNSPETLIIAISGNYSAIDNLGVDCLYKPFNVKEFLDKMPL